jgi:subtilisin family serine protease
LNLSRLCRELVLGLAALTLGLGLALTTAGPGVGAATPDAGDSAHQVLVLLRLPPDHFRPGGNYSDSYGDGAGAAARRRVAQRIATAHGLTLVTSWPIPLVGVDCFVMTVPKDQSPEKVALALARDPEVAGAEPMHVYRAQASNLPPAGREAPAAQLTAEATHNDPLYRTQPAAQEWRLAELHKSATGRNIKVAVIDSMVDAAQPDLAGQILTLQDFVLDHPRVPEQHGTGVAGIIAAVADNHIGIAGVAPHARLMALRACWQDGASGAVCDTLSLAKALYFAIGHDAQVINLSLSGPPDPLLGRLIDAALARGMVVVGALDPNAADGGFPADHPGVVAVSDDPATLIPGALVAPGREAPTTQPGGRFSFVSGSSYAAAHVSGLFALMREHSGKAATPVSLVTLRPNGGPIDTCASLLRAACPRPGGTSTFARE